VPPSGPAALEEDEEMFARINTVALCWLLAATWLAAPRVSAAENALTAAERADGWKLLFDGKSLEGWVPTGRKEGWVAQDGLLGCTAKSGGYLRSLEQYGDFVLSLDFRVSPGANSGLFIRWADPKDPVQTGIEVQLFDSFGKAQAGRHDCGAIYDCLAPSRNACRPAGEWSTMVVTCKGSRISVTLNNQAVVEMDLDLWTTPGKNPDGSPNKFRAAYQEMPRSGHLGLQDHGHPIWFRNLKIRRLSGH
jgi:hypothetical protein